MTRHSHATLERHRTTLEHRVGVTVLLALGGLALAGWVVLTVLLCWRPDTVRVWAEVIGGGP